MHRFAPFPQSRHVAPFFAVAALLVLGCVDRSEGAGGMESLDDLPRFEAVETLRIGSLDDPEYSFGPPLSILVGPDGRIFTSHMQESEIRIHSPEGRLLRVLEGGERDRASS